MTDSLTTTTCTGQIARCEPGYLLIAPFYAFRLSGTMLVSIREQFKPAVIGRHVTVTYNLADMQVTAIGEQNP